jgi:hypothetical protein
MRKKQVSNYHESENLYLHTNFSEMNLKLYLASIFLIFSSGIFAGHDNVPQGGRSAAMANASVALSDFWSLQNNQAGLAYYDHFAAGFYYENRYLTKELSLKSGGVVMPTGSGNFGLNVSYFGYPKYNESKFGLSYARSFGDVLAIGLQMDYLLTSIAEDYGKKGVATFELGILSKINEHLSLGAHIFNPISVKLTDYDDERIQAIIRVGAAYAFDNNLLVCAEVEKDMEFDPIFKLGLEYRIIEQIYVRGGISTNPALYSFGFGLNFDKLKIDFSSSIHQTLGYSPQISMYYNFK